MVLFIKKSYKIKYCVGCELEKTDSELVDGKCSLHPKNEIEFIDEENYFFKFSSFQKQLLDLYKRQPNFVVPDFRFNEIKILLKRDWKIFPFLVSKPKCRGVYQYRAMMNKLFMFGLMLWLIIFLLWVEALPCI